MNVLGIIRTQSIKFMATVQMQKLTKICKNGPKLVFFGHRELQRVRTWGKEGFENYKKLLQCF